MTDVTSKMLHEKTGQLLDRAKHPPDELVKNRGENRPAHPLLSAVIESLR